MARYATRQTLAQFSRDPAAPDKRNSGPPNSASSNQSHLIIKLELSMAPSADPSAVDDGKTIEQLREELAELRAEKDASGCCPFNSAGDKDIYGRNFTLPVNCRAAVAAAAASSTQQPNTYCPRVVHRSTLSTRPRPSTSSRTPSRTCVRSTARGSISFQDS